MLLGLAGRVRNSQYTSYCLQDRRGSPPLAGGRGSSSLIEYRRTPHLPFLPLTPHPLTPAPSLQSDRAQQTGKDALTAKTWSDSWLKPKLTTQVWVWSLALKCPSWSGYVLAEELFGV